MRSNDFDVVIVGGGPAGSTAGAVLRLYEPNTRVLILEKEHFPRDHVGESQLPPIQKLLDEIGAWEKIEAAGFPIKIGASYTWGQTTEPWEFEFLPLREVENTPRPGRYEGWRKKVAFQVDRAIYDKILLDHAAELGCEVREGMRVVDVEHQDDEIKSLKLENGTRVTAQRYVDASGNAAVLRRKLGIEVDTSSKLQNVAFWDYWTGVRLNEDLFGHGVTRVQVRSLPYGWIWYIPLSEDRASVGFVCPASYYKEQQKSPKELYMDALKAEPRVYKLLENAQGHEEVQGTTDWSFLARRAYGKNWCLTGETLGFADPVLAAGLTLTHFAARDCAYTILEERRGEVDPAWLWDQYERMQVKRTKQHIRFAEYWYSANGCFEDVREFCAEIAKDVGVKLSPARAFQWLSTGGLDDFPGEAIIGGFDIGGVKQVQWRLSGESQKVEYVINDKNIFRLNLAGADKVDIPRLENGRVYRSEGYRKGNFTLPMFGNYRVLFEALKQTSHLDELIEAVKVIFQANLGVAPPQPLVVNTISLLEPLANNYFVTTGVDKKRPRLQIGAPKEGEQMFTNTKD